MQLWDEVVEDARCYDVYDELLRHFARERGVPNDVCQLPFAGVRLTISGSIFQLPAVIGAGAEPTTRAVGNVHVPFDLIIDSAAIKRLIDTGKFQLMRGNYRQWRRADKTLVEHAEYNHLSPQLRNLIEDSITKEFHEHLRDELMPSTAVDDDFCGNEPAGLWATNMRAQATGLERMERYLRNVGGPSLTIHAYRPDEPKRTDFTLAEIAALARNVTVQLVIAVGPLYRLKRTPTTAIEFHSADKIPNAKAFDVVR